MDIDPDVVEYFDDESSRERLYRNARDAWRTSLAFWAFLTSVFFNLVIQGFSIGPVLGLMALAVMAFVFIPGWYMYLKRRPKRKNYGLK